MATSPELIKSVARQLTLYLEVKRLEDGFDLSSAELPRLTHPNLRTRTVRESSQPLDRSLKHYFYFDPNMKRKPTPMKSKEGLIDYREFYEYPTSRSLFTHFGKKSSGNQPPHSRNATEKNGTPNQENKSSSRKSEISSISKSSRSIDRSHSMHESKRMNSKPRKYEDFSEEKCSTTKINDREQSNKHQNTQEKWLSRDDQNDKSTETSSRHKGKRDRSKYRSTVRSQKTNKKNSRDLEVKNSTGIDSLNDSQSFESSSEERSRSRFRNDKSSHHSPIRSSSLDGSKRTTDSQPNRNHSTESNSSHVLDYGSISSCSTLTEEVAHQKSGKKKRLNGVSKFAGSKPVSNGERGMNHTYGISSNDVSAGSEKNCIRSNKSNKVEQNKGSAKKENLRAEEIREVLRLYVKTCSDNNEVPNPTLRSLVAYPRSRNKEVEQRRAERAWREFRLQQSTGAYKSHKGHVSTLRCRPSGHVSATEKRRILRNVSKIILAARELEAKQYTMNKPSSSGYHAESRDGLKGRDDPDSTTISEISSSRTRSSSSTTESRDFSDRDVIHDVIMPKPPSGPKPRSRGSDRRKASRTSPFLMDLLQDDQLSDKDSNSYRAYVTYRVRLHTGTLTQGSVKVNIGLVLCGSQGQTDPISLTQPDSDIIEFKPTKEYKCDLRCPYVGPISKIIIGHDREEQGIGWLIDKVIVEDMQTGQAYNVLGHETQPVKNKKNIRSDVPKKYISETVVEYKSENINSASSKFRFKHANNSKMDDRHTKESNRNKDCHSSSSNNKEIATTIESRDLDVINNNAKSYEEQKMSKVSVASIESQDDARSGSASSDSTSSGSTRSGHSRSRNTGSDSAKSNRPKSESSRSGSLRSGRARSSSEEDANSSSKDSSYKPGIINSFSDKLVKLAKNSATSWNATFGNESSNGATVRNENAASLKQSEEKPDGIFKLQTNYEHAGGPSDVGNNDSDSCLSSADTTKRWRKERPPKEEDNLNTTTTENKNLSSEMNEMPRSIRPNSLGVPTKSNDTLFAGRISQPDENRRETEQHIANNQNQIISHQEGEGQLTSMVPCETDGKQSDDSSSSSDDDDDDDMMSSDSDSSSSSAASFAFMDRRVNQAVKTGNLELLKKLLSDGNTQQLLNRKNSEGLTILHVAVVSNRSSVLQWLVKQPGVDIEICTSLGFTALHLALLNGFLDLAEILRQAGVNISHKTGTGQPALHLLTEAGKPESVQWLLSHGTDTTEKDDKEGLAADIAPQHNNADILSLLTD